MAQPIIQTENKPTTLVRAFLPDAERLDALVNKYQADIGGSWSRAHVINRALNALAQAEAAEAAKSQPSTVE